VSPNFGHGFLPRIGPEDHLAIDRCVGPASLWHAAIDLPWAVIDAAWAERPPDTLNGLRTTEGTAEGADRYFSMRSMASRPVIARTRAGQG
jgi:hypothetical protein